MLVDMQLRIVETRRTVGYLGEETAHCQSGVLFDEHLSVDYFFALLESVVGDVALVIEGEEVGEVGKVQLVDHLEKEVAFLAEKKRTLSLKLYDGAAGHEP